MKPLKLSFLLILTVSALLLSGVGEKEESALHDPKSNESKNQNRSSIRNHPADNQNPPPTSSPPVNLDKAPNDGKGEKNSKDGGNNPAWPEKAIAFFTGVLVLVGIGQVVVYAIQAHYMWRGLRLTRIVADAAKQNADAADKSLKLLERAWLMVIFGQFDAVPGLTRINCIIMNTGKTLARLRAVEVLTTIQPKLPDFEPLPIERNRFNDTIAIVFPNTPLDQRGMLSHAMSEEIANQLVSGDLILAVRGFVVYDDIFGERHVTRFCFVYTPLRRGFVIPQGIKSGNNDAD